MASTQQVAEPVTSSATTETLVEGINELKVEDGKPTEVAEPTQDGQTEPTQEGESKLARLHRLCAEGDVMGVRAILSQSLDMLESIGESLLLSTCGHYSRWSSVMQRQHKGARRKFGIYTGREFGSVRSRRPNETNDQYP